MATPLSRWVLQLTGIALALLAAQLAAAEPPADTDYYRDVLPAFRAACFRCHSSLQQEGGLRLDSIQAVQTGGDSGAWQPSESWHENELWLRVTASDASRMPPEGEPLDEETLGKIESWLKAGMPADESLNRHWALQRPQRQSWPEQLTAPSAGTAATLAAQPRPETRLDLWLQAGYESAGLTPVAPLAAELWLRRVYLDLTGIPPTPTELEEFLGHPSPDARERVIDRLLASPLYGQRWGRHWMDVWRYSDWSGYGNEIRNSQEHIWRWRDWIVDSLNADQGYDQMIVEMLAADEVAPDDPEKLRATGFLVRNWYRFNRNTWLQNTIDHTSKGFLGITMGCAQCHDHMYDPISQEEYYRFRAIFEPHDIRTDPWPGGGQGVRVYDAQLEKPTYVFVRGDERKPDESRPLTPAIPSLFNAELDIEPVVLPPQSYHPGLWDSVRQAKRNQAETQVATAREQWQQQQALYQSLPPLESTATTEQAVNRLFAPAAEPLFSVAEGQWEPSERGYRQTLVAPSRQSLISQVPSNGPTRVSAVIKITGGETYHSVGLAFHGQAQVESEELSDDSVYLSAHGADPKIQVVHQRAGVATYPAEGKKSYPIKLGETYRLDVLFNDSSVHVFINGHRELTYSLAQPALAGNQISLWTFDATADITNWEIAAAPESWVWQPPADSGEGQWLPIALAPEALQSLWQLESSRLTLRQQQVDVAESDRAFLEARIAADDARYGLGSVEESAAVTHALAAEHQFKLAQRQLDVCTQEVALAEARFTAIVQGNSLDAEAQSQLTEAIAESEQKFLQLEQQPPPLTGEYPPIADKFPATSSGRRLALARWIASEENPLTARVAANQIWLRHVGAPLVEPVFDFGRGGHEPRHQELLDELAVRLMESQWRMKPVHRELLRSRMYRLESTAGGRHPANLTVDADNHFFWRMNSRRLEGENLRDSMLALSGHLDLRRGGPQLAHEQGLTSFRRSLYYHHAYEKQMGFLMTFDGASVEECYRRKESVTPQQSLALANSSLAVAQSRRVAQSLSRQLPAASADAASDGSFVRLAFQTILNRAATHEELELCCQFLLEQRELLGNSQALTAFGLGQPAAVPPAIDPGQRAREGLVLTLLNHNEFLTIR